MKCSDITKRRILETGVRLWHSSSDNVTARAIARELGITHPAVSYHFPDGIKHAVAEHAIKISDSRIIVQLIAVNHKLVSHFTENEKKKWLRSC